MNERESRSRNSNPRNLRSRAIARSQEDSYGGSSGTDESVLQYTSRSYEELRARDEELFYKEDEGWTFITEEEYQAKAASENEVASNYGNAEESEIANTKNLEETTEAEAEVAQEVLAGALMGDFNDDPTFWSDIGQIVTGLIPIAGQLGDARDLIHALDDITNQEGYKKIGSWTALVLIVIGFVPGVGDAIKSIGKRGLRYLDNNRILKRIGQFLGDNVISPILERVGDLTAPIVGQIKDAIRRKLAEAQEIAQQLGEGVDNVIDDMTGRPQLATEGVGNVSPSRMENTTQPRQNEPLQSTGTPSGSVPSGRVAQPGGQIGKAKSFETNADVPSQYRDDPRFDDLATDPDQGGTIKSETRAEAMAGLEAEAQGLVSGPIKRGPRETEFYDAMGRPWDVKTPPSPPPGAKWKFNPKQTGKSIQKELRTKATPKGAPPGTFPHEFSGKPEPRRIILDSTYLSKADHTALWQWLNTNLSGDELGRIVEINSQI